MNEKDKCHFCDNDIYRMSAEFPWIDQDRNQWCQFHPVAFDYRTLSSTGKLASHLPPLDICQIVLDHYQMTNQRQLREVKIERNVVMISSRAKRTSRSAAEKMLPHSGTMRRKIFDYIVATGGATDFQLEAYLKGKHQSVSAGRRSLVVDGFLIDSGKTIKNDVGNDCIVWTTAQMKQGVLLG